MDAQPQTSPCHSSSLTMLFGSNSTPLEPKVEYVGGASDSLLKFHEKSSSRGIFDVESIPRPLESLQSSPMPPFLSKTYEIIDDPSLDRVVSWGPAGQSFVVWDPVEFSRAVLPRHFKHNNFSSFVRQLNTYMLLRTSYSSSNLYLPLYDNKRRWLVSRSIRAFFVLGFRKIDTDQWEFANENFLRGKKSLLKNINRRRSSQAQQISPYLDSSMETDLYGKEGELQKLRSEKSMLMLEVVKMKQEHLAIVKQIDALNCRMQSSEVRRQQIISFCAKVLRNPVFLMQLKQIKQQKENERSIRKFLKQKQQPGEYTVSMSASQQIFKYRSRLCEPSSTSVLQDLESSAVKQLRDNHLQDVAASIQQVLGSSDKPLEDVAEKSLDPNASFKLKDLKIYEDDSLSSSGFLISFPEEFPSEKMVFEPMPPASESFTRHEAFNSKNVSEVQHVTTCCPQYLASPADDISHELMLKDSLTTVGETWNLGSEAGGSPFTYDLHGWDNIFSNSPEELEVGGRLSAMWDLSSHSPDKGFDIGQCFGSECSLQQLMDEGELKEDHPKTTTTEA